MKIWMAALTISAISMNALAEEKPLLQRVDFDTSVTREIPNDTLTAQLSVELNAKDPSDLASQVNRTLNQALTKAKGFNQVKVSSGNNQTWPVYGDKNKLTGWRTRAEVRLESRDFKAAGDLIAQLQQSLQLNQLQFGVSADARRDTEKALTTEAIKAFQEKAERIRDAWGAKAYTLIQMNVSSTDAAPPPMIAMRKAVMMADAAPESLDVEGGQSRLTVTASGGVQLLPAP